MKVLIGFVTLLLVTTTSISAVANTDTNNSNDEPERTRLDWTQDSHGNYDLVIDLSNPDDKDFITNKTKTGTLKVKIIHMIPTRRNDYIIQVEHQPYSVSPLTPAAPPTYPKDSPEVDKCPGKDMTLIGGLINELQQASTSKVVAEVLEKIKETEVPKELCETQINDLRDTVAHTEGHATIEISHQYDARITVSLGSTANPMVSKTIKPIRREWISSYGFGFVNNRDRLYYSAGNATDGYQIAEQENRKSYSFNALLMFTYPMASFGNGIDLGVTGGIGASQDNVSAVLGGSLIVNKNFIITGGLAIQEFSVLKGRYQPLQSLGSEPIDSADLVDSTYKHSAVIVLSYRFGR